MNTYLAVTDLNWYRFLSARKPEEVNFWNPRGQSLRSFEEGDLILFKLKAPVNAIAGGGFFVRFHTLPIFLAWDAFREKNGVNSVDGLRESIRKYRGEDTTDKAEIGCTILSDPFWFPQSEWIPLPNWKGNVVKGRTLKMETEEDQRLFEQVKERLAVSSYTDLRYSMSMAKHRLGQGAFRVMVTEAYSRRCAITGEKTLPVLEAAHIVPFSDNGPNLVTNGLLLKSDFHTLFDKGYLTVTPEHRVEISHRLHEDFGNGKDYYRYNGSELLVLPQDLGQLPDPDRLRWHNEHVYLG